MSSQLTPADLTDSQLDHTVAHLRTLSRSALLQYALEVGRYLIDEYFGGDTSAYFDPSRSKASSFGDLLRARETELKELQLSARTLRNYICAWDVWQHLPVNVQQGLDLTDLYKLALVKDTGVRARLAVEAVENAWDLQEVGAAVELWQEGKREGKSKRGPKVQPGYILNLRAMDRQAEHALAALRTAAPAGIGREQALAAVVRLEARVAAFKVALGVG